VKNTYVEPGRQTDLVRDLAREATEYVESRGLVTVPPLAKEIWRMEMLSPERQKVSPFFLGGEVIQVSYPTDEMSAEDKLMSLRGNNPHFSRATVHHELIPGHHLQRFMTRRYMSHRQEFSTPFWTEGWALYWEMRLWDLGFARGVQEELRLRREQERLGVPREVPDGAGDARPERAVFPGMDHGESRLPQAARHPHGKRRLPAPVDPFEVDPHRHATSRAPSRQRRSVRNFE